MKRTMLMVGLMTVAATPAAARPFDWLVGNWCTHGGGARTCEHWAPMRDARMIGGATTIRAGKRVEQEDTVIRLTPAGAVYDASPDGAPVVPFRQTAIRRTSVTFANPAHDYPQRIRYWRAGADLIAEIALADGSKPMRWHYRRVP